MIQGSAQGTGSGQLQNDMKKNRLLLVSAGFAGILLFCLQYNKTFPAASVNISINKQQAYSCAQDFLTENGFDVSQFHRTISFASDNYSGIYLQKKLGMAKANEMVAGGLPIWYWRVRYYKELDKKGYAVCIDPSDGKVLFFNHYLLETDPGVNLTLYNARLLAEDFLCGRGIDPDKYEIKEEKSIKKPNRTDHYFVWENNDFKIEDAALRVNVGIYGDEVGSFMNYLKIPETFTRDLIKETATGPVLAKTADIFMLLTLLWSLYYMVSCSLPRSVQWKRGLACAGVFFLLQLISFLNNTAMIWNSYPSTVSMSLFYMSSLETFIGSAIGDSLMLFAFFTLGSIYADHSPEKEADINIPDKITIAYSIAFIFLGYLVVFYELGQKYFNVWMPLSASYTNILGTYFPFTGPLTVGFAAALSEEFIYRMLSINFLRKVLPGRFTAVFVSSLLWGFAHSSYQIYPVYMRGIELTVFGIILGIVYLRYGLGVVVLAHFVMDIILAGVPLLRTGQPGIILPVLVVLCAAPCVLLLFRVKNPCGRCT